MNSREYDAAYEVIEGLHEAVHDLVDDLLAQSKLTQEQQEFVRMKMTEDFRFWERSNDT